MRKKTKENKRPNSQLIQIGFLLLLIGIGILLIQPFAARKLKAVDRINQMILEKEGTKQKKVPTEEVITNVETSHIEETKEVKENKIPSVAYIGKVEIPKIQLKRGFVAKDSKQNNISQNITILKESRMPDEPAGNFILAAHSGTGVIAYFKKLDQLEEGDIVYIDYEGKRYQYQIADKYRASKTGDITIYRNQSKSTLTLITCATDNDEEQVVVIAYLVNVE